MENTTKLMNTKESCDMFKIGFFAKYPDKITRISMYKKFLSYENIIIFDMILYDAEIQNEIYECHETTLLVFKMFNQYEYDKKFRACVEYKKLEKLLMTKYISFLINTNQIDKILNCPFKDNKEIAEYIKSSEIINKILVQKLNIDLYEKIMGKIIDSVCIEKKFPNKEDIWYVEYIISKSDIQSICAIIEAIKNIKFKDPCIFCQLLVKDLPMEFIEKLMLNTNGIFSSIQFIHNVTFIDDSILSIICEKFGTKILTKRLIDHILRKYENNSIVDIQSHCIRYINIILKLQHVYGQYSKMSWEEFHKINNVNSSNHVEFSQHDKPVQEDTDMDTIAVEKYFSNFETDSLQTSTNATNPNCFLEIHNDMCLLFKTIIKFMTPGDQNKLTKDTIVCYNLEQYLCPELAIKFSSVITAKMAESISPETLLKSGIEFDENVNILKILAHYKKNDIGEIIVNLIKNEKMKTQLLSNIKLYFKDYDFVFIKKLCEIVPEIITMLYESYVGNLNANLKRIGCTVLISENSNVDYLELLHIIYNAKRDNFICKICETHLIDIVCKICCNAICSTCSSSMKVKKCPYCQNVGQELKLRL